MTLALALVSLCLGQTTQQSSDFEAAFESATRNIYDEKAFLAFLEVLPRKGRHYVLEGDVLASRREVYAWLFAKSQFASAGLEAAGIVLQLQEDLSFAIWNEQERGTLSYAVDAESFGDAYPAVSTAFAAAARDWEHLCADCGIRFIHRSELDASVSDEHLSTRDVGFIIRRVSRPGFVAVAFYPHWPVAARVLEVSDPFFTIGWDPVGIFRHEIGHILGYRHEHVRGAACERTAHDWKAIGEYDPDSVMQAPCGRSVPRRFEFSEKDRAAHRTVYRAASFAVNPATPPAPAPGEPLDAARETAAMPVPGSPSP